MQEEYKGYCFMEDGSYLPAVKLRNVTEVVSWVRLQRNIFQEIIVVDQEDFTVMHVMKGKVIHPAELASL